MGAGVGVGGKLPAVDVCAECGTLSPKANIPKMLQTGKCFYSAVTTVYSSFVASFAQNLLRDDFFVLPL